MASAILSSPPSYSSSAPISRSCLCGYDRADDVEDGIHGLFEIEVRGVDDLDAGGGGEEVDHGGVLGVAAVQRVGDGTGVVTGQLGAAARGAHRGRCGEQDAHRGVGGDDGGDVAALDDDARAIGVGDERAEQRVDASGAPPARARRR